MNLQRREVVKEIEKMIASASICMVSNTMLNWPLSHQSIKNQWFDTSSSVIWFLFIKSDIESNVFENGRMEVFYANAERSLFMSLSGEAQLVSRSELPPDQSFPFQKTLENDALGPSFGIVRFSPADIYSWDNDAQNMVALMLQGDVAAVAG